MFAFERVLGLGVIEILLQAHCDPFPPSRCVTGGATGREASVMRIPVAVVALAEGKSEVPRLAVRSGRMTLFAPDGYVLSGERIARLGMVEGSGGFSPVVEVVTLLALRSKSSLVRIFMTGCASLGNAKEGPIEILQLNQRACARRNVLRRMTFLAFESGMLSF
jgi:hypothetical protein